MRMKFAHSIRAKVFAITATLSRALCVGFASKRDIYVAVRIL